MNDSIFEELHNKLWSRRKSGKILATEKEIKDYEMLLEPQQRLLKEINGKLYLQCNNLPLIPKK